MLYNMLEILKLMTLLPEEGETVLAYIGKKIL